MKMKKYSYEGNENSSILLFQLVKLDAPYAYSKPRSLLLMLMAFFDDTVLHMEIAKQK